MIQNTILFYLWEIIVEFSLLVLLGLSDNYSLLFVAEL